MPRARTVAALEDVQFCTFCGDRLTPATATMFTLSYPPTSSKRFTDGRWFGCGTCQPQVTQAIGNLKLSIRQDRERQWAIERNRQYTAILAERAANT